MFGLPIMKQIEILLLADIQILRQFFTQTLDHIPQMLLHIVLFLVMAQMVQQKVTVHLPLSRMDTTYS